MSQEVLEIVRHMNLKDIETQLALQCAPLITGIKISNLLIIQEENQKKVKQILRGSGLSYVLLANVKGRMTFFLYHRKKLEAYLRQADVVAYLAEVGYANPMLTAVLPAMQKKYQDYADGLQAFPHEVGILLGYPVEDVRGFVEYKGQHALYSGYWKVYAHVAEKKHLFGRFEDAKETLIQLVSNGVSMADILDIYHDEDRRLAAV